jgi:hypothetical protein
MESFIKKIFEKKQDEWTHVQFQKFSRGEFRDRAMFRIKNSAGKYTIDTTAEYARELVKMMGEKLGERKSHVNGALVSALDLQGFTYEDKKMAMGVRKYILDREISGKELVEMSDKLSKVFFGLSFNVGDEELKIQAKSPKSAKGASGAKKEDADLKIDFCKIKTTDKNIVKEFLFDADIEGFKKAMGKHDFLITDIVIPQELKAEKDFAKVREGALRKGKIVRVVDVDGKKVSKEVEFEA